MSKENLSLAQTAKFDIRASVMVFFVALPLCLGVALASGAPLFSGVIAGIVGGIIVGFLSGSALGVSGPAAGLTVIVLAAIADLGSFQIFLCAMVLAGIMQLALGYLKAGIVAYYFPSSVIKGMLTAIGIIIVLKQIPHAIGYDDVPAAYDTFEQIDGHNTFSSLYYMFAGINFGAVIVAAVALAILILWEKPFIKKMPVVGDLPGSLIAVFAGVVLGQMFENIAALDLTPGHMVEIPVPETPMAFLDQFTFPDFSQILNEKVWITAITLAAIASIETLLCLEASDKLDPFKRVSSPNRELKAQGIGNIASGLIGGLPVTQVIVRSSANIQGGAKTKLSTILHGVFLLVSVMFLANFLNMIPLASLAAILIMVGYKLASPQVFQQVKSQGKTQFIPFIVTVLAIIFTDLLMGIFIGMIIAAFHILYTNYRNGFFFRPEEYKPGQTIVIHLIEHVTFLNKASISQSLTNIPDGAHVVIDGTKANDIDYDVWEIIEEFVISCEERDIKFEYIGEPLDPKVGKFYNRVEVVEKVQI